MTGTTERMIYLSLVMTLLCSFTMVEVLVLLLEELLLQMAQDHNTVEVPTQRHIQDFSKGFPPGCGFISAHFKEPEMA